MRTFLLALSLILFGVGATHAECICQCVDGEMEPLCESSIDLRPICPLTMCPIVAPSTAPIDTPTIPPPGTSQCKPARVCDTFGNCRWQRVCD